MDPLYSVFLFCAVVAGAIFSVQFVMSIVGFGGEDADIPDDLPDSADLSHGDFSGGHDHFTNWIFGALSLRTIVAAVLFFGLGGLTAYSGGMGATLSLVVAVISGVGAFYGLYFLMRTMYSLGHDGTLRMSNAIGTTGTVYLPIPAEGGGKGKVHLRMQGRLVELAAMTKSPDRLRSGTSVKVVGIVADSTVEVEPIREPKPLKNDAVTA